MGIECGAQAPLAGSCLDYTAEKASPRALLVLTGLALAWAPMIVHAARPEASRAMNGSSQA